MKIFSKFSDKNVGEYLLSLASSLVLFAMDCSCNSVECVAPVCYSITGVSTDSEAVKIGREAARRGVPGPSSYYFYDSSGFVRGCFFPDGIELREDLTIAQVAKHWTAVPYDWCSRVSGSSGRLVLADGATSDQVKWMNCLIAGYWDEARILGFPCLTKTCECSEMEQAYKSLLVKTYVAGSICSLCLIGAALYNRWTKKHSDKVSVRKINGL
ncbi:MAG: hypothetical protein LBJ77_04055 [Holosporales bacterium]|jgi:hypothetical protein|nr:hypothetical protein [Holosporales bacterium]